MHAFPDDVWNQTDFPYPDTLCIHELFEQQVSKTPKAIALIDGNKRYTYHDINKLANQLARRLQKLGLENETVVGCILTRSSAIVVCTLAILKAGGTYLLLDSTMPLPRLGYILSDAQPAVLLTDTQLPDLQLDPDTKVVQLGALEKTARVLNASNITKQISNTGTAYIAYTSGSTGRPKGVRITHKSTVNHSYYFSKRFNLSKTDRVPLMAPIAFDMAIEEMVPPLVSGCTLIVSKSVYASMQDFTDEVIENAYTILNIPAPLWQQWTEYLKLNDQPIPSSLRIVIAGSEKISTKTLSDWQALKGADAIWWIAAFGTTETTVTSTFYTTAADDDLSDEQYVPIGKPIANTYTYILDKDLKPVAVSVEGELYIGGQGLAQGYHNLPEMTAQKFIPDPFRKEAGARMYRTGDWAKYRADGDIAWLGRVDSQIKLHGLRIEPGEIENILHRLHWVKSATVVLHNGEMHDSLKHLVAYIESAEREAFNEVELHTTAAAHLPRLMIPAKYIHVQYMPLNTNGKIDRKSLEQTCEC
jgi:amino acid adenylation domain-containing protein